MVPRRRKRTKMDSTVLLLGFLIFGGALNCASAWFTVLGPDTPVIVSAGDDALLRCRLSINDALTEARWYRIQSDNVSIVHVYQAGKDQNESQIPYAGRTELLRENISHGDVSLNISKIGPSDEGQYRCYLETDTYFDMADFELKVTAVGSVPSFYIKKVIGGSIIVTCTSDGWYPLPKVLNENANGTNVMTTRQKDGFYSVQYSRVITEKSDRSFSCAFESSSSDQRREASFHASDQYFEKPSEVSTIIMASAVMLTLIAVAVAAAAALPVYLCFKMCGNPGKAREKKEKAELSKQLVYLKALVDPAPFPKENISLDPDTAHPKLV